MEYPYTVIQPYAVVPRMKCDIPFGYLFRSPVVYYAVIYHIECDMLWEVSYTTTRWRLATYQGPRGISRFLQTCKKFVSFRDPSLEFIIISAKYPTKNQQFRHFTQIDDWFLLQNCQNTLYFIILSTKEVLFLLKTSILLQLWKKFPQLYRNFRDPGSRGSRVFPCLCSR